MSGSDDEDDLVKGDALNDATYTGLTLEREPEECPYIDEGCPGKGAQRRLCSGGRFRQCPHYQNDVEFHSEL